MKACEGSPHADDSVAALEDALFLGEADETCPYLENRQATFRFGNGFVAGARYRELLDAGYRRHGHLLYRPVCKTCDACEILRVRVQDFVPRKSHRRVWKRGNRDFAWKLARPAYTPEKLALYRRYLQHQHNDPATDLDPARYRRFLVDTFLQGATLELQLYHQQRLAGVGIIDTLGDALSAVYFYFDPDLARYSPGTYSILKQLDLARDWGMQYYYPGYYIRACPAMNYKAAFTPCETKRPAETDWHPGSEVARAPCP